MDAAQSRDPSRFLPLTDLAFNILMALADDECHGYALIKELRSRTGRAGLRTGTVYAALARLQDEGLVAESRPPVGLDDNRRKYYKTTDLGRSVARAEAARLMELVAIAQAKKLVGEQAGG